MDYDLMQRALTGDFDAARAYVGDYYLLREDATQRLYRSAVKCRAGFTEDVSAYDSDGFLLPEYWTLERLP